MYRFLTWAVGVIAAATVIGAIGYDLSTERIARAYAASAPVSVRPAGEISNDGVERLVVIPLLPVEAARTPIHTVSGGPLAEPSREEMGYAMRLVGAVPPPGDEVSAAAMVEIPPNIVRRLAGGIAWITVWARADRARPATTFAMSLSIDGGFKGWHRFPLVASSYESYGFGVPVPADAVGKAVRVLILPDTDGKGAAISVSHLIVDRVLKPGEPEPPTESSPAAAPAAPVVP
ncbi:hypothetical protein D3874_02225 [Oleomonas cavernae]|uniref:Uncharacterized protein n=1 Tax=Oleomonas cavernae TaxID=2320859 RepID=A0A418WTS3_9PROT|nr:hypothetical protein [Oleomonas cavernae]RJF94663.1 hypothetical protein D3874_02225 [Oleomonas cavernae]